MSEQDFEQEMMRVLCTVSLNMLSKSSAFVATNEMSIERVDEFNKFEQEYPYKFARGVINKFSRRRFCTMITKASSYVTKVAKHQSFATTSPSTNKVMHVENDEYYT